MGTGNKHHNEVEQLLLAFKRCDDKEKAIRLMATCDRSDAYFSLHDGQAVYQAISPNMEKITGYCADELIGNSAYDLFHPDDYNAIFLSHARTTLNPEGSSVAYRFRKADDLYLSVISYSKELIGEKTTKLIFVLTVLA